MFRKPFPVWALFGVLLRDIGEFIGDIIHQTTEEPANQPNGDQTMANALADFPAAPAHTITEQDERELILAIAADDQLAGRCASFVARDLMEQRESDPENGWSYQLEAIAYQREAAEHYAAARFCMGLEA